MSKYYVEKIFITEGVPEYTFVPPPNYNDIYVDIRKKGKPVIIEGQSGTGKTCTAKKILESISEQNINYYSARKENDIQKIISLSENKIEGTYIIDDFHRLPTPIQQKLIDIAKLAAEEGENTILPKLIIIGINQLGGNLIQLVPDIAKRCGIHKIKAGDIDIISKLIKRGCELLNLELFDIQLIYSESKGDYWLTQHICQAICLSNNILETTEKKTLLQIQISQLRQHLVTRLKSAYHQAILEFCRGNRFRPSNDPYFKFLKIVAEQENSNVDLEMLANSISEIKGSINNIKEKRLTKLLNDKQLCSKYFYYNNTTKQFAIEDPALFYYLKHLDWKVLRIDCGFRSNSYDFEYDFAISFAGENRELARIIAEQLELLDTNVFFDEYYENNFLGKVWGKEFKRIFGSDSRFVICLLDEYYH